MRRQTLAVPFLGGFVRADQGSVAREALDGTGGGGGSGNYSSAYSAGGQGGDGIVIVRYLLPVLYGTLSIDVTPDSGSWTVSTYPPGYTGPFSGAGDLSATTAPPGSYTVTYSALAGYRTPESQTLTVAEGANAEFVGTYTAPVTMIKFR